MADYDFRPGGSLKLKGGVADGGIVKKYVCLTSCTANKASGPQKEEVKVKVKTGRCKGAGSRTSQGALVERRQRFHSRLRIRKQPRLPFASQWKRQENRCREAV